MSDRIKRENKILRDMLGFEAKCKSFVIDPLYGPVSLTRRENEIIETHLMRRLKNIKQLGFISNLYPAANHSRFEHSIGTLHTTWEIFKRFIINSSAHRLWLSGFNFSVFDRYSIQQALRLSGLLHDIGHGPYSHTFETIFEDFPRLKLLNHESLTLYMLSYSLDQEIQPSNDTVVQGLRDMIGRYSEWEPFQTYRKELSRAINDTRLQRYVLMILNNNITFDDFQPPEEFTKIRKFLNALITSDVGSDRVDYLLRDTYFTGLGYRFNLYQILESIVATYDRTNDMLRMAIDSEFRNAVEFLLTTRYYHYRLIAHNPLNLDQEFAFRCNLKLDVEKNPIKALELATLDEYEIQKHLSRKVKRYSRVFTSYLRDIKINRYRYFFYRIANDSFMKKAYVDIIKRNIVKANKRRNPSSKLKNSDIHIVIVLEKPHIPLLHVYRKKYRVEMDEVIEYHSNLLHDWSDIIIALGRTYLLDSLFMVYVPEEYKVEVEQTLCYSRRFYLSSDIFKRLLARNRRQNKWHRLDILLFSLYKATKEGSQPIVILGKLFEKVMILQKSLAIEEAYSMEDCYDPEKQERFDYCMSVLNDLLIFGVSEIIGIDLKYMSAKKERGKLALKPKYEITPIFDWVVDPAVGPKRRENSNLERILQYYPKEIRKIIGYHRLRKEA
ncbi:MAG: HD domain-containing protein [Candidatus Bathyarchaeia archaeon]